MRKIVNIAVALGATAAVLAPTAAQAAGTTRTAPLGTYGFGRAGVIGEAGVAAGAWRSFSVRSGFAGDDLTVTYQQRTTSLATEKQVYTAAFNTVADAQGECLAVGAAGVARKVWVSFRCQTGFAPSYTLFVR